MYDVNKIREDFPILSRTVYGKPLVYLDNGATTQKPRCVVDAMVEEYYSVNANVHRGVHFLSQQATNLHEASRETVRRFINAGSTNEIVFTRGTTESINLVASSFVESQMKEGDEVIVSVMEHHSNIVSWQLQAMRKGIVLKVIPMNDRGELLLDEYEKLFSPRTRLVSVAHVSNVLGTINPVKQIIEMAHAHQVPVLIDGAQGIPHMPVDVQDLDADFYVFSGHKIYGPTGVGVLYGKENWLDKLPPYQGGGEMIQNVSFEKTTFNQLPFKFEAGTPDYIGTTALAKALDYVSAIGMDQIAAYEHELTVYAMQRLKEAAEKAKIELSGVTTSNINLPYITADATGPKHLDLTLTRAKFNELTAHLVEATAGPVRQALGDAGLTGNDIHKVLMVGGSSRIPAVQDMVKKLTGKEGFKGINPDECVAMGAALQGGVLTGDVKGLLLLDVTPLSLGIETMGGVCTKLIDRNTTIPVKKSQIFSTAADNQTSVEVNVLQGEREMAAANKSLGRFHLDGIAPARRGVPQIEVTFDIDANGIVNVSAKDLGTGTEQHITITSSSNMSKDDIEKAVKEAEQYAAQDKKMKEDVEVRNQADQMVYQSEKTLNEMGDKIPAEDKSKVQAGIDKLKEALKGTDTAAIKTATDELTQDFYAVSEKLYQQANPQGAQGGAQTGPDMGGQQAGGAQDGQYYDADYKVVDDDNQNKK